MAAQFTEAVAPEQAAEALRKKIWIDETLAEFRGPRAEGQAAEADQSIVAFDHKNLAGKDQLGGDRRQFRARRNRNVMDDRGLFSRSHREGAQVGGFIGNGAANPRYACIDALWQVRASGRMIRIVFAVVVHLRFTEIRHRHFVRGSGMLAEMQTISSSPSN